MAPFAQLRGQASATRSHAFNGCLNPRRLATVPVPRRSGGARLQAAAKKSGDDEPDLIERAVGFFFGKKALSDPEPMGLKRLNFDELPDQYVELEEEAAPVAGDAGEVAALRRLLKATQLEALPLRCAYDAEEHGWSPLAFHQRVDGFGAGLVVGVTAGGAVVGGYNPEGWISLGEDRMSNGSFLFTWPDGDMTKRPSKLPKIGGPNLAVIDKPDSGPQFGAEGLTIPLKPRLGGQERTIKSRLGTYYERMPGNGRTLFSLNEDPKKTQLVALRVYVAQGQGVEYKLDGITWKSSRA